MVCLFWGSKFAIVIFKKIIVILIIGNMLVLLLSGFGGFETGSQYVAQAVPVAQIGLELVSRAHSTRNIEEHICSFPRR